MIAAELHFDRRIKPRAIVATCLHCRHSDVVAKPVERNARGIEARERNMQRGRMIRHVQAFHAEVLKVGSELQ